MDKNPINSLAEYVMAHVDRGACRCGKCADAPENPEEHQPTRHTQSVFFFDLCVLGEPDADVLRQLVSDAYKGEFGDLDMFDGKEHHYMEIGGWIGDQGLALMLIGLGGLLGLWKVFHPGLLPLPAAAQQQMAGSGYVGALPLAATE